jgi:hypothetical protein
VQTGGSFAGALVIDVRDWKNKSGDDGLYCREVCCGGRDVGGLTNDWLANDCVCCGMEVDRG